jgi:hypothetical protein
VPYVFFGGLAAISCFSIVETVIHWRRLSTWLASCLFLLLGIGVGASSFAVVNLCLAHWAEGREARGWFGVFAAVGTAAAVVAIAIAAGMTVALRRRLYLTRVLVGSLVLFLIMCGMFAVGATTQDLNWW